MRTSLDYMRINHGCFHILVSQQLLNGAYVSAGLQQVSGKGMPQCVAGNAFVDPGSLSPQGNRFTHRTSMHMPTITEVRFAGTG